MKKLKNGLSSLKNKISKKIQESDPKEFFKKGKKGLKDSQQSLTKKINDPNFHKKVKETLAEAGSTISSTGSKFSGAILAFLADTKLFKKLEKITE
jgi:hypothetical protein